MLRNRITRPQELTLSIYQISVLATCTFLSLFNDLSWFRYLSGALSDTLCSNGIAKVDIFFFLANFFQEIFHPIFSARMAFNVISY